MQLKDGPFKQLNGAWIFTPLNDNIGAIAISTSFEAKLNSNSRLILQALSLSGVKIQAPFNCLKGTESSL
jgi:ribosome-associated toxin RatA of RatAB toxin-antitoxin module